MTLNDRIILNEVLKQRQAEVDPNASESDFFELFTAEQILKDFDLSYDEIESGLVGDGGDGGVDGIYLFVNGDLVQEEQDLGHLKKDITLDLIVIQAKTSNGFAETPIERFTSVSDDILDLSKDTSSFSGIYNEALLDAISRFRDVHKQLASRFPLLRITYYYACKGIEPSASVEKEVEKLESIVKKHFPWPIFASGSSELLACSPLRDEPRRAPTAFRWLRTLSLRKVRSVSCAWSG
jgi:hypothetical protein